MYGKLKSALLAAIFVGLGSAGSFAADLAGGTTNIDTNQDGSYYVHNTDTADDAVRNANTGASVTVGSAVGNGAHYIFGASGLSGTNWVKSEGKVNVNLANLSLNGNSITLVNGEKLESENTNVSLTQLDAANGGNIVIEDSVDFGTGRRNVLGITTLLPNGGGGLNVAVGANSLLAVTNFAILGDAVNVANFQLGDEYEKGYMQFNNGLTLQNGQITGNGYIKGNILLSGSMSPTAIVNASGKEQVYDGDLGIGVGGGQIIVGYDGIDKESRLEVTGTLSANGTTAGSFVSVAGTDATTSGTLVANDIALVAGGVANVGKYGNLVIGETGSATVSNITNGYVNVGENGKAVFNNAMNINGASAVTADKGKVIFNNDVKLQAGASLNVINGGVLDIGKVVNFDSGTIFVSDLGNSVVVGNGIVLSSPSAIKFDSTKTDNELSVLRTDNGAFGSLAIDRSGAIDFSNAGGLSTLKLGDYDILGAAAGNLYTGTFLGAGEGAIEAVSFTVAKGADVRGHEKVTTTVERAAAIQGKYDTAGEENFLRGVNITNGGELAAGIGNAKINIGDAAVRAANVLVNNGTLSSASGKTLTLVNVNPNHESDLVFADGLSTVKGTVVAEGVVGGAGFGVHVDGDVNLEGTAASLSGTSYSQYSGVVQSYNGVNQKVIVTGTGVSTVSGRDSVFTASADFGKGVNFTNGATLRASDTHTIAINGDGAPGSDFNMDSASVLDLAKGDVILAGYENVNLMGTLRLGFVGGQTTMANTLGSGRTVASLKNIELTQDFVTGYDYTINGVNDYIFYDNTVTATPRTDSHVIKNVFGDYGFRYVEGDGAWLESVKAKDVANVAGVRDSLAHHWGAGPASWGFATNVSAVAQNMRDPSTGAVVYPAGNFSGSLNYEILKNFALGNGTFSHGSVSGVIDSGLLAAYNGSAASGVIYTSQDVTREIVTTLHARIADVRAAQSAIAEIVSSDEALASLPLDQALNNQYLGRIWAGGLGMWNHADARKGFDGYKYDGSGIILGYDRAFGSVIGGVAAAYMKGDYEDKTATGHDSEIKNYAVDAYLTYSACSGFFATVAGGFNYSDNDIRERRGGNWATEDYHTDTWHVGGKVGFDFAASENLTISPTVGVDFFHSRSNEHALLLDGHALTEYGNMRNHNVEIPVKVNMAYNVVMSDDQDLTLMASGGYAYNLNDHGVSGNVGIVGMSGTVPMRAVGRKLGHHSWNAGAGVKYRRGQWDVGVKYDYYGRGKSDNHRLMGAIGYSF